MGILKFLVAASALWAALTTTSDAAVMQPMPPSLAYEALSETFPTAFAPAEFRTEDFTLEWNGTPLAGAEVKLEPGSLEWVRVQDVLVLPRARLRVSLLAPGRRGTVSQASFTQPMLAEGEAVGRLTAEMPVALLSGAANEITIDTGNGAVGKLRVRFAPREGTPRGLVGVDTSCSRFGVSGVEVSAQGKSDWMYIGCRLVGTEGENQLKSSLELFVLWDGAGPQIGVDGTPVAAASASVWLLRARARPGKLRLSGAGRELDVAYAIPERLRRGALAMGIGPYSYHYQSATEDVRSTVPILTLYGSYQVDDAIRIVAFDATTFSHQLQTDLGVYVNAEQFRTLDRRIGLSLMLGANVIGTRTSDGEYLLLFGAPQGFEVNISDFLGRNRSFGAGAFIYPSIAGKAYYNAWVRWGSPSFFGEVNFISWEDTTVNRGRFYSRSFGVSVGFPLARFL